MAQQALGLSCRAPLSDAQLLLTPKCGMDEVDLLRLLIGLEVDGDPVIPPDMARPVSRQQTVDPKTGKRIAKKSRLTSGCRRRL